MRTPRGLVLYFTWALLADYVCVSEIVEDTKYWMDLGRISIEEALIPKEIHGIAKNVILFIGDGMGMPTITASRIFKGQQAGHSGEEGYLFFEKFPHVGLTKTYNVDRQVPDSAGTATALFSGVKGNYYTVGFDSHAKFNVCNPEVEAKAKVPSLLDWAISAGKSTGLVTTTRITHATPAAAYGHCVHRDWECDSKIPEAELKKGCKDLGRQLIEDEPGKNINIILGGGEQVLRASINDTKSGVCSRKDGKDLVWDWMKTQRELKRKYKFVKDKEQLLSADNDSYILGLFANGHMPYDKDRELGDNGHPSLTEMVGKAIDVLEKNKNGYLLIVEGGRIDHANHDNLAKIALEEVVALDAAIQMAKRRVNLQDTIMVVTADHSHSMSINGYPKRGNPIEGVGDVTPEGFAYQTLSYINGPGYNYHRVLSVQEKENDTLKSIHTWRNLNITENLLGRNEPHHAGFWMDAETHGGEDVPVYAIGPMAHLFHGVHEQTHVAFTIAYSACIGPYAKECRSDISNRVVGSYSVPIYLPQHGVLAVFMGFMSFFTSKFYTYFHTMVKC
ncbi:unnamed protein product [Orchesella dallaii]|uniref:Alkaline phosphatase n=1 Tax=Orchesella dallaii TaxID=48710 RepID=A0ABP1PUL6_9HEXA